MADQLAQAGSTVKRGRVTQVQARALLGEDAEAEAPLFENGLGPSGDGFFGSVPD